jgi:dihydroflavonol-4-reductase
VGEGRSVRALARTEEGVRRLAALGAEPVLGDVLQEGEWKKSLEGCTTLFHTAGYVTLCGPRRVDPVHVEGTRAVVAAAASAGVDRVVYTSSAAAIGERKGEVATEKTPHSGRYLSYYAESKHLAEQAAFEEAASAGLDLVAVNPTSVQGPGRARGSARLFIGFLTGRLRWAVRTTVSLVSIGDCVEAHLLAAAKGASGERYLVSGWTAPLEEVVGTLGRVAGIERRLLYAPGWLFTGAAAAIEFGYRLLRRRPPLCRESARTVRHGHRIDGSKAERDLGLRYTSPEVWLAETVEWYRDQGLL